MTVSSEDNAVITADNRVTTIFSFPRIFYDADHIVVSLDSVEQSSGYSVSGTGTTSGSVTFSTAPTSGQVVRIERVVPFKQDTDFEDFDGNPSDVTEKQFDLVVMMSQQLDEITRRALVVPKGDTATSITIPSVDDRVGGVLYFDSEGNPTITTDSDSVSAAASAASAAASAASASAAQTAQLAAEAASVNIKWRSQVKASTTANITLSGAQTIDGISCIAGDRVLVKSQTAPAENGIYVVAAGSWTRATDADTWAELISLAVSIEQGSSLADTQWICTVDTGGTIGVTAVTWAGFLTTPRDGSVSYVKIDVNAIATTGQITTKTTNKLINAAGISSLLKIQKEYTSTHQTVTSGGTLTLTHGLGAVPKFLFAWLVCQSNENGYTAGEVVAVNIAQHWDSGGARGVAVKMTSTQLLVKFRSIGVNAINWSTGNNANFADANWKIYFYAAA